MTTIKIGNKVITDFKNYVKAQDPTLLDKIQVQASIAQMTLHDIHARAIACHCECLGMNAENAIAICLDHTLPFGENNYIAATHRWGLTDEKGKPTI